MCMAVCKPKCECDAGFVLWKGRNGRKGKYGKCIPEEKCPKKCPANSTWNECGSPCTTTCENKDDDDMMCLAVCEPKCECDPGFVYYWIYGKCIPEEKCPKSLLQYKG